MAIEIVSPGFQSNAAPAISQLGRRTLPRLLKPFNAARVLRNHGHWYLSAAVAAQPEPLEEVSFTEQENRLIETLIGFQGRGGSASPKQLQDVTDAVKILEDLQGVPNPTNSELIEGRWQLMFTTRPRTASPIQRTIVGVDLFSIFQEVYLRTNDPCVSNVVKFSDLIGDLRIEAQALSNDGRRILFQFKRAIFSVKFLPFKVLLPFALFGEGKGWLDTTYLSHSGNLRISRGSKGTAFVLQKKTEPRQRLLSAISTDTGVEKAIGELISQNMDVVNGQSEIKEGRWRLIWSSQSETESWLENASKGLMGMQIVKENGKMQFLVDILFGIRFSMYGTFVKYGSNAYEVRMDDAAILVGKYGLPLEMESKFCLELLYIDDWIRISKGYSNFVFVHLRANE